ncbi:hypothetical protein P8605_23940 [Streptomyces sp. T-3]|nr:hypothetical protein [Streptomyces sp. T-3]
MGTSGRYVAALCAGLVVASLAACGPDRQPSARPAHSTARADAAPSPTPFTAGPACEVALPGGWRAALAASEVKAPDGARAVLTEAGPDARWVAVQLTEGKHRRAALIPSGDSPRTLLRFADPVEHQLLSADFDGRRAVFAVLEGRSLGSPWTLYVWDADSGKARRLARSTQPGPLPQPVLHQGQVYWAQGLGGGKAAILRATADSSEKPRTLHTGVFDTPFAAGERLVWREGDAKGTRLLALSLTTGRPTALPARLAKLRDIRSAASDGRRWAWVEGEAEPRLRMWQQGMPAPTTAVAAAPSTEGADQVRVGGDLITWRTTEAAYALDLRASSYARVTPQYGYAQARNGTLAIAYSRGDAKSSQARAVVQVARTDRLPRLPGCDGA